MNNSMRPFLNLGKTIAAALLCTAVLAPAAHAQDKQDAAKKELATRIVNLQKAQDMDALIAQLAGTANRAVVEAWLPRLDNMPAARQKTVADQLDVELKKFNDDVVRLIKTRNERISIDVLVPAYSERFTADELKQLVAFLESPVIKKYYAANPHMANLLGQKLVEATRADVESRIKEFDARAAKIIGAGNGRSGSARSGAARK
ncbi:MAG: DUF2059 domain-containing protein [Brachymonas sp.]|nr:DUF2059 domain-containing protein [Brachymonas sp.]